MTTHEAEECRAIIDIQLKRIKKLGLRVAELKSQLAETRKALLKCRCNCEHLHHVKSDRHEWGEDCPVEKMIKKTLTLTQGED